MGTGAADNRIIAIIQLADKGVAAALFGCLLHLCVRGTGSSHADILPDTAVKQVVVLRYIGNLVCNFRQRHILQLMAAEGNAAGCNIPIPGNQLRHRRFAGAGRPYKGGHGSGVDGEIHIMQNLCCPVIGKRHRPKRNAGIFQLDRRFFMVQFFGVQKLADFFHICPQYGQIVRKGKGRNNRPDQPQRENHNGQEGGKLQTAGEPECKTAGQHADQH